MTTADRKDYYAILEVPPEADQKALKRAFRDLARRYHPDRNAAPDAQERFKEIAEAYAVLSDPQKRADYDHYGPSGVDAASADDLMAGLDLGDLLAGLGLSGFGPGGGLFGGLFGGPGTRAPTRGGDLEVDLTVPLATVLTGGTGTVQLRRPGRCAECGGSGVAPGTVPRGCDRCRGTGRLVSERRRRSVVVQQVVTCPACGGTGTLVDHPCPACAGAGTAEQTESLTLRIPRGIAEGTALRLPGRGMPAPSGRGAAGDAYVVVRTAADNRFVRRDADLWHTEEITVPDAVLGTTLTVPALDGELSLTVPPGTRPGAVLSLAGHGLPHPDTRGRGDLYVSVTVRIPDPPDATERQLYRQLREHAGGWADERAGQRPEPSGPAEPAREGRWKAWWRRHRPRSG